MDRIVHARNKDTKELLCRRPSSSLPEGHIITERWNPDEITCKDHV
jgi:hypothetical protein